MAETNDDDNIFRLLVDEHRYFMELTKGSKKLADELLRYFLEQGETDRDGCVRYRFWQIRAVPGGAPSPYDGAFWRSVPARGIRCEIDVTNSSARWTGPASAAWRAEGRETAEYEILMIRLNHRVVLDYLISIGLLQAAPGTESAAEPDIAESEPKEEPPTPAPEPALTTEIQPQAPETKSEPPAPEAATEPAQGPTPPTSEPMPKTLAPPGSESTSKLNDKATKKKVTLKGWLRDDVPQQYPRPPGCETNAAYARYLKPLAPKDWEITSIENELSKLPS